jgi:hypothetical protein
MFIPDMPNLPPQDTPIVLAQACGGPVDKNPGLQEPPKMS